MRLQTVSEQLNSTASNVAFTVPLMDKDWIIIKNILDKKKITYEACIDGFFIPGFKTNNIDPEHIITNTQLNKKYQPQYTNSTPTTIARDISDQISNETITRIYKSVRKNTIRKTIERILRQDIFAELEGREGAVKITVKGINIDTERESGDLSAVVNIDFSIKSKLIEMDNMNIAKSAGNAIHDIVIDLIKQAF